MPSVLFSSIDEQSSTIGWRTVTHQGEWPPSDSFDLFFSVVPINNKNHSELPSLKMMFGQTALVPCIIFSMFFFIFIQANEEDRSNSISTPISSWIEIEWLLCRLRYSYQGTSTASWSERQWNDEYDTTNADQVCSSLQVQIKTNLVFLSFQLRVPRVDGKPVEDDVKMRPRRQLVE